MTTRPRWLGAVLFSLTAHAVILGGMGWLLARSDHRPPPEFIDSAVGDGQPMGLHLGSRPQPPCPLPPALRDGPPSDHELQLVKVETVRPAGAGGAGPVVEAAGPAGGGTNGSGGGSGPATFFRVPIRGRSVVYLIDRSLSMGVSGSLGQAREQMLASLRALPPGSRFQVFLYNRGAEPLLVARSWGLLELSPEVVEEVETRVRLVRGEGGTDHTLALRTGLALQPDVLFLVTDADDLTARQVQAITRANAGRTAIHTIDLGMGKGAAAELSRLAGDNGGRYVRPRAGE